MHNKRPIKNFWFWMTCILSNHRSKPQWLSTTVRVRSMSPRILAADARSAMRRRSQPAPPPNHRESQDPGGKSLNWYPNLDSYLLSISITNIQFFFLVLYSYYMTTDTLAKIFRNVPLFFLPNIVSWKFFITWDL